MPARATQDTFRGFPAAALDFYAGLEADNTKSYWTANRAVYEEAVRAPFLALSRAVEDEFGPLHLFRPHRDVRFSRDKSPYKTNQGAVTEGAGGALYYVHLDVRGLFAASGYYRMAPDQLERFRTAVLDERAGPALERELAALPRGRYELERDALKTAPRGYPRDHPRIELLRRKSVTIGRRFPVAAWLQTRRALDRVTSVWREAAGVNTWLDRHVGPSILPPPDPAP